MAKQPVKQSPGFSTKAYSRQVEKITDNYKKNTRVVKYPAIQDSDQRSSQEFNTRVSTVKHAPKSMTYGASKNGKGTTVYKKGKA